MGGLLFHTERMEAKKFNKFHKHLTSIFKRNKVQFQVPRYFADKKDFGDLDVLILGGTTLEQIKSWFVKPWYNFLLPSWNKVTEIEEVYPNGPVISIKYKNFQIDFIRTPKENWGIAYHYFSWNDLGNLMGRLAHKMGLKYGMDGLTYPYHDENGQHVDNIEVSKDIDQILFFLDLDVKNFHRGFDNLDEIFNFVYDSKLFDPYIYDMEHLNKINRDRNKKRTTYAKWLEYCEPLKTQYSKEDCWFNKDKKEFLPKINCWFPGARLLDKIEEFKKRNLLHKERNEKFNGGMLVEHGFKGAEIGKLIADFKQYIFMCFNTMGKCDIMKHKENVEVNFNKWLDSYSAEQIKNNLEIYLLSYKK
jgi:hypothetical protein